MKAIHTSIACLIMFAVSALTVNAQVKLAEFQPKSSQPVATRSRSQLETAPANFAPLDAGVLLATVRSGKEPVKLSIQAKPNEHVTLTAVDPRVGNKGSLAAFGNINYRTEGPTGTIFFGPDLGTTSGSGTISVELSNLAPGHFYAVDFGLQLQAPHTSISIYGTNGQSTVIFEKAGQQHLVLMLTPGNNSALISLSPDKRVGFAYCKVIRFDK